MEYYCTVAYSKTNFESDEMKQTIETLPTYFFSQCQQTNSTAH